MHLHNFLTAILLCTVNFQIIRGLSEYDSSLLNSKTGKRFTEILIDSFTTDLINIANDKREQRIAYSPNDIAAVQAIRSMEKSLFDLSAYYAKNQSALVVNKYLNGLAIEFSTTRCDSVVSNRYPRNAPILPSPWSKNGDYVFYSIDCRANASDISSNKYKSLHPEVRLRRDLEITEAKSQKILGSGEKSGKKRSRKSINDPSVCGMQRVYSGLSGNLSSPGFPGNYSAGITCIWHIKLPVKYAVSIKFDMFSLELDKFCFFDSVEFFDGASVNSKSIRRVCGTEVPVGVRSSLNVLTIKMKTDDTIESYGFRLRWNFTEPNYPHPGYLVSSNIIVDQLGPYPTDLNKFRLVFQKPRTCPLRSKDVYCYFQYKAVIISRIISTQTLPQMNMSGKFVDVKFDHIIDLNYFPSLYRSKKYCMRWNDTVAFTENGAWSRYGGILYRTDNFSTTCRFEEPGIFAVFAESHAVEESVAFQFTGTFYAGIFFSIIWLIVLIAQWVYSRRTNVPEWINFNQAVCLVLFLGVVLSGLHLQFVKATCSLLAFFLYYFGLGVFFWQFLKAAQVSGKFDEFFAKGRNIYLFYFLLGWTLPIFIAGLAAGALFSPSEEAQSCWLALVGGSIWGYTSPTYFLVLANVWILYKVWRKTKKNLEKFNHPQLRNRVVRDLLQLLLYIMTWVFGILCVLNRTVFSIQFMFSLSITLSVLFMSLGAKQRRPGYQKIHYVDAEATKNRSVKDKAIEKFKEKPDKKKTNGFVLQQISMRAYKRWQKFRKHELKLGRYIDASRYKNSFDYNAYYELDEEGSRPSLRVSSSLRSESALKVESDGPISDHDHASDNESELNMSSSDEEEHRSSVSSGSRIEIKADVIVDGRESAANELGDGNNRSRMNGYDTEAGRHSMNQSQPRITPGRVSAENEQDNASERRAPLIGEDDSKEGNENLQMGIEASPVDEERGRSREQYGKDEEDGGNGENEGENGDENQERREDDEEQQSIDVEGEEEAGEKNDDESGEGKEGEGDDDEEGYQDLPKLTVNAFGGSEGDDNGDGQMPEIQRSPAVNRHLRTAQQQGDDISMCSLEDEDEVNNEDEGANESHA